MDGSCTTSPLADAQRAAWAVVQGGKDLVNGELVRIKEITGFVLARWPQAHTRALLHIHQGVPSPDDHVER